MRNLATRDCSRLAVIGTEHEPRLVVKIAQVERPGIRACINAHRHGRKALDGARAFRAGLATQVGRRLGKPVQVVGQAALIDLPALPGAAIGIEQVVRVHKVRTHIVHVELGHGSQAHIGIVDHAARDNARLLHDAIARHAKLLHVRKIRTILKIRTGDGLNARHVLANNLAGAGRKDI